ncbi:MAG: copper amine oxidase, partial [Gaiellaceae bacterium]
AALDENTVALGEAIGSVYGDEAEQAFLEMWREHIGFFVDYTVATAEDDQQGRQAALDKLAGYRAEFSQFLGDATGLPAEAISEGLQAHVDQLTGALDQYAAGDYEAAYATERGAYEHMWMTGDTLAGAIVQQNPDMFSG